MRYLKIKNDTGVKELLALVGESCDNSILAQKSIEKLIKEQGGRLDSSRLATFFIKCTDKDFPCDFSIIDKDNKDNKCGEKSIQIMFGDRGQQIPIETNNITDFKKVVIDFTELFITGCLKDFEEIEVEVNVVGD